jgi:hypothetical protein
MRTLEKPWHLKYSFHIRDTEQELKTRFLKNNVDLTVWYFNLIEIMKRKFNALLEKPYHFERLLYDISDEEQELKNSKSPMEAASKVN